MKTGYTLIESIIGIVMFTTMTSAFLLLFSQSITQTSGALHIKRATQIGQLMMDEVFSTGHWNQPLPQAYWGSQKVPLHLATIGPEESARHLYNDIDDYHGFQMPAHTPKTNKYGEQLDHIYQPFDVSISVRFVRFDLSTSTVATNHKLVEVVVIWEEGEQTEQIVLRRVGCNY